MSSTVRVEDSDPSVLYSSSQWIEDTFTLASGGSRHGAALPELTVSFQFHGTGVQVVGILDPSVNDGQSTTMYILDGAVVNTYTAPWTSERTFDVVYYANRDVPLGDHTIEVTNYSHDDLEVIEVFSPVVFIFLASRIVVSILLGFIIHISAEDFVITIDNSRFCQHHILHIERKRERLYKH
ncbi:hypothetical protein C8T65DRAFT_745505 [Cerioporus squamosus]|nr:hypothetical protein C8T65DRAFT_745505 [Cerioporus squamosus]